MLVLKTFWRRLQDMSWRRLKDMSWRRLQYVFSVTIFLLQDVLKTSWRYLGRQKNCFLEDVLKTCAEDVLKTCLEDVMKTCLENVLRTCLEDVTKTSWRETNIYWGYQYLRNLNLYLANLYFTNLYLTNIRRI